MEYAISFLIGFAVAAVVAFVAFACMPEEKEGEEDKDKHEQVPE